MSYVLIIVLCCSMGSPLKFTFANYKACEAARIHIVESVTNRTATGGHSSAVISSGCYGLEYGK